MEIKSCDGKSTQIFTIKNARCFEQCKYVFTEKIMSKYITSNIEISLDYFNREDSDKRNYIWNVSIFIFESFRGILNGS